MNDDIRPIRMNRLPCPYGCWPGDLVREYNRGRGDDLKLGLTKGEVIVVGRERKVGGDTVLLSNFHGPNAPCGGVRRRNLLRPEDLASEECHCNFPDGDDPPNSTEQCDVDDTTQEEDRVTSRWNGCKRGEVLSKRSSSTYQNIVTTTGTGWPAHSHIRTMAIGRKMTVYAT